MRNRINIDRKHSFAILQEIGERLRGALREEPDFPANFGRQIDQLRELERGSPRPGQPRTSSNPKE